MHTKKVLKLGNEPSPKSIESYGEIKTENVRGRILSTARDLIYREGARAVGVDRIVAESGVAKTSLYRWFKSKDDLITAVLEEERAEILAHWDRNLAENESPLAQLRAQFRSAEAYITSPKFRGCCFLNAATAFADETHPARVHARSFKEEITQRLFGLCEQIGAQNPKVLADQLSLLIDGAYISAQTVGVGGPCIQLQETADALIRAQMPPELKEDFKSETKRISSSNLRVAGRKN
jgi:AcrR family transcriptional regulator